MDSIYDCSEDYCKSLLSVEAELYIWQSLFD
jgi:hypothetical protein